MKWFLWLRRIISLTMLLTALLVAAWIFWPSPQRSEQQLLGMVPTSASAVVLQRDLASHVGEIRSSAFLKACSESPFMPIRVSGDSTAQQAGQQALFDLLGDRFVLFMVPGTNGNGIGGACVLTSITPRSKWVWLRVKIAERLHKGGFEIRGGMVDEHPIHEVVAPGSPIRIRYAIWKDTLALGFDGPADSLRTLFRPAMSQEFFPPELPTNAPPHALQLGSWRQGANTATWVFSQPEPGRFALDLVLPKQRTVRLPWDDARGPRPMALIQHLFPDQDSLTVRGRASHWMAAWDNVVAWLGLPPDLYSETMLMRTKYREHLSHGQFPWSGAGDELALVVAPAADAPLGITFALRCWETNDTQMAINQFLQSLSAAAGARLSVEKSPSVPDFYSVQVESGGTSRLVCQYRYVEGLVIASNSLEHLRKFDPTRFAGQELQPSQPENQIYCKADQLAATLDLWSALAQLSGNAAPNEELNSALSILKTLSEVRATIRVGKETVEYRFEGRPL